MKLRKSTAKIDTFMTNKTEFAKQKEHENQVKSAEVLLAASIADHNIAFQVVDHLIPSKNILIYTLQKESNRLLMQFCQNFIKPEILETLKIQILHPHNYLDLENIFIEIAHESFKRLPINNPLFNEFEFIQPTIAFAKNRKHLLELPNLINQSKDIVDTAACNDEWRNSPFYFTNDEFEDFKKLSIPDCWKKLSTVQDFAEEFKFKNISQLAFIVLTLPHSNAECERIFSIVNDVKTKKRNKLGETSLNSICVIRSAFKSKNIDCTTFEATDKHIQLFKNI
ncbi:unnamed protein product [Diabrotica balteata]|uniref:HAT C-terminal dimerisation domain-containing protein n=1 Tax=Diabrotica balteata TaxID=107213 RepID=A0A9N9XKY7_DIABA|nr:unnamed protein product [Diabrotica balteata]